MNNEYKTLEYQIELRKYQQLIINWAKERNITDPSCIPKQKLKLIEEIGELSKAILKNDVVGQVDGVGDIFVVLTILAEQNMTEYNLNIGYGMIDKDFDLSDLLLRIIHFECDVDFDVILEICNRLNLNILTCVSYAWNEIKDRKGKTVDGTFLKDEK